MEADWFIPSDRWISPERDRAEKERLWPKVWLMACREEQLPKVGSYITIDIVDDPVLVIRTGEGPDDLSAIFNVCQHRGRKLVDRPRGLLPREIPCRFHGWRFDWDGSVAHVTNEEDWDGCPEFDKAKLGIPQVRTARWAGFVWICMNPDAPPLDEWLGSAKAALDPFRLQDCRALWWKRIHAPVNWKVYLEAFNEGYHAGETHASGVNYRHSRSPGFAHGPHVMFYTVSGGLGEHRVRGANTWKKSESLQEELWANNAHLHDTLGALTLEPSMAAAERVRVLPRETSPEETITIFHAATVEETERAGASFPEELTIEAWMNAGTDWHIFPNFIVLPSLDGALVYRSLPDPKDRDKAYVDAWSFGRFAPDKELVLEPEYFEGFENFRNVCPFLEEDFANMEAVNLGMKSRGFKGANLSPNEEIPVSHFHHMLDEYCGKP